MMQPGSQQFPDFDTSLFHDEEANARHLAELDRARFELDQALSYEETSLTTRDARFGAPLGQAANHEPVAKTAADAPATEQSKTIDQSEYVIDEYVRRPTANVFRLRGAAIDGHEGVAKIVPPREELQVPSRQPAHPDDRGRPRSDFAEAA